MPLAARTIEPIYLCRRSLREGEEAEEVVQVAITQNAVLGALVQLASLVRHADDLFCDLADECQKVFEQTERIIYKVKRIKEGVGRLDSKKVPIPMGDLKQFSAVQDHHVAKHGFDCSLFTSDTRPHCIKARYTVCDVTPVGALRGADMYRKDGLRSSDLFKLWPVVIREHKISSPDMNQPRKLGKAMTFNKRYKRLKPRPKTVHSINSQDLIPQNDSQADPGSESPTNSLSRSQPSILVAVDTSGAGFYRMSSFRQSLKGTASLDRKKKRRRTVSGVPDNIMHEIEAFERGKRNSRNTPRNYSFDDLDACSRESEKDRLLMQQLDDELDAKLEERAEQVRVSREPKLLKLLPCRRSRSLPRCLKVGSGQTRGVMMFEEDKQAKGKEKGIATAASGYGSSSLSLGSAGGSVSSSGSSRTTKRSSIIGNKIRSFVSGTLRPRPKSLDFDSIDVLGNGNDADAEDNVSNSTARSKANLKRTLSPSMPDDISSLSSSRESKVGPGTYYYFTSSTLPRSQARKYDFPWESLPKDWTTAVKLREISRRRKEERNSSSGNWSGSSNRQSLDSARSSTLPASSSQHSLSRDSGRDSPSMGDDKEHDGQKAADGGVTFSSFMPPTTRTTTDSDTEQWLAALAKRAAAREDEVGSDVTESLNRLSELTRQNIQALEDTFSPVMPLRLDDEVSSVYSLDQDGFYTSFHNDSGLRRSTGTLLDDDGCGGGGGCGGGDLTPVRETHSTHSMGSSNTIDSVIFRPMGDSAAASGSSAAPGNDAAPTRPCGGKVRPAPPVRSGSKLSTSSSLGKSEGAVKNKIVAAVVSAPADPDSSTEPSASKDSLLLREDSSTSESDHETVCSRLKAKTQISSRAIPSWCAISDDYSTDSSSVCLAGTSPQERASVSFSGSAAEGGEGATAPFPLPPLSLAELAESAGGAEAGEEDTSDAPWSCSTLPRRYLESKVWEEDLSDHCNSWPRSRRGQQNAAVPVAGILKRDKSPAGNMKPKTLNFAPVVSMFDQNTPLGVELPLHASSASSSPSTDVSTDACNAVPGTSCVVGACISSDSLSSSTEPSSDSGSQAYTLPALSSECQVAAKYQPCITVKPGPNIQSGGEGIGKPSQVVYPRPVVKPTSGLPKHYAVTQLQGVRTREPLAPADRSVSSSESSLPSLSDCGQGGYLNMTGRLLDAQSLDTLSSASSSAALSDIDSSLTYVTMSSQNSTPTNSSLALFPQSTPDPNLTPTNSPSREPDTYRISQITLAGSGVRSDHASSGTMMAALDSGPVLQAPAPALGTPSQNGGGGGGRFLAVADRQWLGSFSPNASTEAAPPSWLGERLNGRTLSGDSGFSSPTTPTSVLEQQQHHLNHHQPHQQQKHQPHHHRNFPPSANRSNNSSSNNAQSSSQNHKGDVFYLGDSSHSLDRKSRTSDPPSQLSIGQRHEPLKASHSQQQQQKTPRSDSYRAATKDLAQFGRQPGEQSSGDGSARPKKRSQSSAQIFSSKPPPPHPHMPKSISCPTGVLEETEAAARADSYRLAVRNTQGVVGDVPTRNTSYRMATQDDDPVVDSRMEAINNWEARGGAGGRDMRRMGITDIDQLKCYDSDSSSGRTSSSSLGTKSTTAKGLAGITASRKKQKAEVQSLLQDDNSLSLEIKRTPRGRGNADKSKRHSSSSTYIRFDPIFEQGDDMYSSSNTLRAESVEMIASEQGFLMSDKVVGRLPPGRVRGGGGGGGGRKSVDNNAVMSILGSIKTTIKSMSGKNASADKDMWKYDGGL